MDQNELDMPHQFSDSVSDIKFKQLPNQNCYLLAASSWDGKVAVWQVTHQG